MADVTYTDSASVSHTLETEPGDGGGAQIRPVHGLPDDVKATLSAIKTAVEALSALISGGKLPVLDSTVDGRVDGVESKLDTLHTDLDTVETRLQTIADNQAPAAAWKSGQNTDIDTGAAEQFSSQALTRGMYVKNISASGQILYLGPTSGVTSTTGFRLDPGETSPWIEATNADQVYMLPDANNAIACYVGF